MARYARAAAALFALVSGALALRSLSEAVLAPSDVTLQLRLLFVPELAASALLAGSAALTLVRGDRGWRAARVAGILLLGNVLGFLPIIAISSPTAAVAALAPAVAALVLLATSRAPSDRATNEGLATQRVGRLALLVVAAAATVWAVPGLAHLAGADVLSALVPFFVVRAGFAIATLHVALVIVAQRFPAAAFLLAGAVDAVAAALLVPTQPVSEYGVLLVAGIFLLGVGLAAIVRFPRRPVLTGIG